MHGFGDIGTAPGGGGMIETQSPFSSGARKTGASHGASGNGIKPGIGLIRTHLPCTSLVYSDSIGVNFPQGALGV
jgi:hypothetical protein